jgi:hypothetical protein
VLFLISRIAFERRRLKSDHKTTRLVKKVKHGNNDSTYSRILGSLGRSNPREWWVCCCCGGRWTSRKTAAGSTSRRLLHLEDNILWVLDEFVCVAVDDRPSQRICPCRNVLPFPMPTLDLVGKGAATQGTTHVFLILLPKQHLGLTPQTWKHGKMFVTQEISKQSSCF